MRQHRASLTQCNAAMTHLASNFDGATLAMLRSFGSTAATEALAFLDTDNH